MMQQQGTNYPSSTYYPSNPNPNPNPNSGEFPTYTFASAPPYSQSQPQPYSFYNPQTNSDPSVGPPTYAPLPNPPPQQSLPPSYQSYTEPPPQQPPSSAANSYSQPPSYYPTYDPPQPSAYVPPSPPPPSQYPNSYGSYNSSYAAGADSRFDQSGGGGGGGGGVVRGGGYGGYSRVGIGAQDDVFGDGVYQYDGGRSEPYGARGTKSASSWSGIDDYGRSTSFSSSPNDNKYSGDSLGKMVKAVPKDDNQQDAKSWVQKFRVKLLAESSGQSTMDVICQIGLDGIRMLDPNTNRTLRIYPLETVTKWEVSESTYSFWSKSSVDIEPRRIRLQSSKYTTNTILDTVAAATVQLKEMGGAGSGIDGEGGSSDSFKTSEQQTDKKKGLFDFVNKIKSVNEEKDHWVPDEVVSKCMSCSADFGAFLRRHHCRSCGDIFCDKCTTGRIALTADEDAQPVRVCDKCMTDVSRRLSIAKETASRLAGPRAQTHEDLARRLQEEMEKKSNISTASMKKSSSSGRRMREVVCPTCTVHLQVELPNSGSETIECGVCQHPFLVNAR